MSRVKPKPDQTAEVVDEGIGVVWRDGVPYAMTADVLRVVDRIAKEDAELLRRLAE